ASGSVHAAVKSSLWLVSEKLVNMVLVLVVNIFVARYLAPAGYGELAFILATVALVAPIGQLGMQGVLVREFVNYPERERTILSTAFAFRTAGGLLGLVLLIASVYLFLSSSLEQLGWLLLFGASHLLNGLQAVDQWYNAKVKARAMVQARTANTALFALIKIGLVVAEAPVSWIFAAYALELILQPFAMYLAFYAKAGFNILAEIDWRYGFNLLKSSWWLILSGFASIINLKIDQIMLAEMSSMQEVGYYAVAARLSEIWYFIPTVILSSFFPALLKVRLRTSDEYNLRLSQFYSVLFWIAALVAVVVSLVAEPVIQLLYGEAYLQSAIILEIHVWAGIFIFMRALFSKWLIAENILKFSLVTHGLGALVNLVLNYYMIPVWGGIGAAYATVISYAVASFFAL